MQRFRSVVALKRDLFTLEERYNACSDHLARGETVDFDKKFLGYNYRADITSYMFFNPGLNPTSSESFSQRIDISWAFFSS
jgi:hypothetical protein